MHNTLQELLFLIDNLNIERIMIKKLFQLAYVRVTFHEYDLA